ncbi:MAG: hypothetical protein QOD35_3112 [Nocardioidaceae bacterium]|jgi:hypothetical protein|nr:hypothetical protein [Nocardioidaceae bacterium]
MTPEELASKVALPLHKARAMDARAREVVGKPLAQCNAVQASLGSCSKIRGTIVSWASRYGGRPVIVDAVPTQRGRRR